eukprot:1356581-Ditylum_brightwellii.AAC.2
MKKSTKPAPATTSMVIHDDPFNALPDIKLLFYEEEIDKKKFQLNLVPQACGFSTDNHANPKCNVEYDVSPTAQHSMKVLIVMYQPRA